jgi:hypothetical protein
MSVASECKGSSSTQGKIIFSFTAMLWKIALSSYFASSPSLDDFL